ncbi:Uncharacterised protein [Shigella sonnei]|nr:Uncharacterised protein [Shigella sonnei]
MNRLQEWQYLTVDFRAIAQRINIVITGLQITIDANAAINRQPGASCQGCFRAQSGGGNYRIHFDTTLVVQRCQNARIRFFQPLQLRFQQQMNAHLRQPMLQAAAYFWWH